MQPDNRQQGPSPSKQPHVDREHELWLTMVKAVCAHGLHATKRLPIAPEVVFADAIADALASPSNPPAKPKQGEGCAG